MERITCDTVVVGAGPSGLAAAIGLATAGAHVVVVEENAQLGGKLRGQLHEEPGGHWWVGQREADNLAHEAMRSGVRVLTETVAWAVTPGWQIHVHGARGPAASPRVIDARALIVATGAIERPVALPGWTLPGVMTIGCAQVLTNIHRVRPGRSAIIVGIDPLAVTVGRAMALAGVDVKGIVLPPRKRGDGGVPATLARLTHMTDLAPHAYMRIGGRLLRSARARAAAGLILPRALRVWSIPTMLATYAAQVHPDGGGLALETTRVRGRRTVDGGRLSAEVVCVSGGLAPLNDLLVSLGVAHVAEPRLGGRVPVHSEGGVTAQPGLFVTGNAIGVESAVIARAHGAVAAAEALEFLGTRRFDDRADRLGALRALRRSAAFQFFPDAQQGHDRVHQLFRTATAKAGEVPSAARPDVVMNTKGPGATR